MICELDEKPINYNDKIDNVSVAARRTSSNERWLPLPGTLRVPVASFSLRVNGKPGRGLIYYSAAPACAALSYAGFITCSRTAAVVAAQVVLQ